MGYPGRSLLGAARRDPALLPAAFKCSKPSQMILEINMDKDSKPLETRLCSSSQLPKELGESELEETESHGSKAKKFLSKAKKSRTKPAAKKSAPAAVAKKVQIAKPAVAKKAQIAKPATPKAAPAVVETKAAAAKGALPAAASAPSGQKSPTKARKSSAVKSFRDRMLALRSKGCFEYCHKDCPAYEITGLGKVEARYKPRSSVLYNQGMSRCPNKFLPTCLTSDQPTAMHNDGCYVKYGFVRVEAKQWVQKKEEQAKSSIGSRSAGRPRGLLGAGAKLAFLKDYEEVKVFLDRMEVMICNRETGQCAQKRFIANCVKRFMKNHNKVEACDEFDMMQSL